MQISELGLDERLERQLAAQGLTELWPSQVDAAPAAAAGENLVVAVPTASGKTLIAMLALISRALEGHKGVYIVPLRALASEKYHELRELGGPLGLRIGIATGDLDTPGDKLGHHDIVVMTSEKADALLRRRTKWLEGAGCIVADEVHLIHDAHRGPTLEVLLSRFRALDPDAQLVALSATVANAGELADWLGARLVVSDWRPVPLKEGVLFGQAVTFSDNTQMPVEGRGDEVNRLVEDGVRGEGQCLVFVNTRRSAEAVAVRLSKVLDKHLTDAQRATLDAAARPLVDAVRSPVRQKLGQCIAGGAAFHHAGLESADRTLIEDLFKQRVLFAISATPTLAAGINLPSRRVVIRDVYRFDGELGTRAPIPVLEYKQMAGRAGRPKYDDHGEAITIAKSPDEREELLFNYLMGTVEEVESKLVAEPAMRVHVLASIAMGYCTTEQGLSDFFRSTLMAQQSEWHHIERKLLSVTRFLEKEGFIDTGRGLRATPFGQRTSSLYLDPASAVILRDALKKMNAETATLPVLHAVCAAPDMRTLYLRRSDAWIEEAALELEPDALLDPWRHPSFDWYAAEVKTALLLEAWMDEATDEQLMDRFGAYPGDVRARTDIAQWLLNGMRELAAEFNPGVRKRLTQLIVRVRHGVREDLLPLIKLDQVGRYRARQLDGAGLGTIEALKTAPAGTIAGVHGIGPKVAASIKTQLGEPTAPEDVTPAPAATAQRAKPKPRKRQVGLGEFVTADALADEGGDDE